MHFAGIHEQRTIAVLRIRFENAFFAGLLALDEIFGSRRATWQMT
jgi:hypothetical protein